MYIAYIQIIICFVFRKKKYDVFKAIVLAT